MKRDVFRGQLIKLQDKREFIPKPATCIINEEDLAARKNNHIVLRQKRLQ